MCCEQLGIVNIYMCWVDVINSTGKEILSSTMGDSSDGFNYGRKLHINETQNTGTVR